MIVGRADAFSFLVAGTHFLEYSLLVVTVISLGHLGTVELAAASIANMVRSPRSSAADSQR